MDFIYGLLGKFYRVLPTEVCDGAQPLAKIGWFNYYMESVGYIEYLS
jgi:hypothetical protein